MISSRPDPQRSVLITGASSGIGFATAHQLLDRGWRVFAAARRLDAMEALRSRGAEVLPLDLADQESRVQLADVISCRVGALDALVNNAGYGETGPVETMPIERARAMFEVNVFGLIALTQLLLPSMRERRRGRIVNLSSIAGRFVTPGAGWYGASKHALEGISDALRLELHSFGLQVVLVEPGLIRTGFEAVSASSLQQQVDDPVWNAMMRRVAAGWAEGFRRGSSPELVARTIVSALETSSPKPRYRCGSESEALLLQRFIPTQLWDALVRQRMIG
jgi:NAD(P)-dependent dehydrogenase (short-subunit alcohol dehydrogenase family)